MVGLFLAACPVFADTRDLVRQGNEHYAAGRYAEALQSYEAATGAAHPSPELLHDLAAAHFKLGQLDEARDLWVRIKEAGDAGLEARTRYNLGNCDYAEALAAAQQNPQQALDLLETAVEQYRTALGIDPGLTDARANLELTQQLKKQIEELSQQQPQSQPSQDQQQKDKQKQPPSSQPSSQPESQPAEQDQQQQQDQSASSQPSPTQPAEQPEQQQPQDQEQQQPEQPEEQQAPESQPQTRPAATQPAQPQPGDESPAIHLSREQAERLLQMIRDAEKARREKLAQQRTAGQKKVERDW